MSHGGATTNRPTVTAPRSCCTLMAQPSSSTDKGAASSQVPKRVDQRGEGLVPRVGHFEVAPASTRPRVPRPPPATHRPGRGPGGPRNRPGGPRQDARRGPAPARCGGRDQPKMSFTRSKNGRSSSGGAPVVAVSSIVRRNSSTSFRCSLESFLGTWIFTLTNRSPWPRPGDVRHALALEAEHGVGRRALGNVQGLRSGWRVHRDRPAEGDDRERDVDFAVEVVTVALELGVLGHVHDHVQVARRATGEAGLALAVQPQALARGDAGRDLDGQLALACDAPRAPAPGARLADHAPRAAAQAARAGDGEEALLVTQLARPAALPARLGPAAGGRAGALAGVAGFLARDLDGRLGAGKRLLEADLEVVAEVGAALRAAAPAASAERRRRSRRGRRARRGCR